MYSNILVPIDPAHGAVAAHILRVARWMAGKDGRVTILHAIDMPQGYITAQIPSEILERHQQEVRSQVEALATAGGADRTLIVQGSAATAILEQATADGSDAIVLGSHRPDYRDYLIGSTAARVVRHAACTVLVERSRATA